MRALRPIPLRAAAWSLVAIACSTGGLSHSLLAVERTAPKANAEVGLSAEALLEEALTREIYGLADDRDALLEEAEALGAEEPAIKWHRGLIHSGDEWISVEQVAAESAASPLLSEYVAKRDASADSLRDHLALADWCAKQGLKGQERAHLARVLTFEPDHAIARERLGFIWIGNEWIGREDIARAIDEEAKTQASIARHRHLMENVVRRLTARSAAVRANASNQIQNTRDVSMIPALEALVAGVSEEASLLVIDALSGMSEKDASLALARFAVLSPSPGVRSAAAERLKGRNFDHFVPEMLASMTEPTTTERALYRQRGGRLVFRHSLFREAMKGKDVLVRDTVYDGSGNRDDGAAARFVYADSARLAFENDLSIKFDNLRAIELNWRIGDALDVVTDQNLGGDCRQWWDWWNQHNEVVTQGDKPVRAQYVASLSQVPRTGLPQVRTGTTQPGHSCFAAGTPVLTNRGDVSIERIRVGDLVLAQDVESGELAFQPVLETTVGPLNEILRIEHAGGSLRCTGGHPFWVSGEGWIIARRLKSGMELHSLDGPVRISQVVIDGEEPAYNLIVDRFADYFVGESRILCHDISDRRATDALVPGLEQK